MTAFALEKYRGSVIFLLGLSLALFQLIIPVFFPELLDIQTRALHITLGLSAAIFSFPSMKRGKSGSLGRGEAIADLLLVVVLIVANGNAYGKAMEIVVGASPSQAWDVILGGCLIFIVLECARRAVGWVIPAMVMLLMGYIFFGEAFPGIWKLKGIGLRFVVDSLYYSPLGIYGSVTGMSATFISTFIIFGALLSTTGGGRVFTDMALALTGRHRGGPAKASVLASALFGSISGSSVANVMVTGNYTIPLMKKMGYSPEFAGAVEAIASSGGGITPPLMSVTVFMMAEFLNISYLSIVAYALLPCLLFYTGVLSGVHFRTIRMKIETLPEEEIPRWSDVFTLESVVKLFVPIGVLLYLVAEGQPLHLAGFYACMATLAVYLATEVREGNFRKGLRSVVAALSDGGRDAARIIPILVSVSMLVNLIGLTGISPKISGMVLHFGGANRHFSLLIATIVPFLLGTSLPVIPTYVLSVSILVPSLLRIGIDPVAAHLFFIYCAVLGGVTPPVCPTAVAAAGIANGNWFITGITAMRLGAVAFILPYFFALNPALVGRAPLWEVFLYGAGAFIGTVSVAYGFFSHREPPVLNRVLCTAFVVGGILLLFSGEAPSTVGVVTICGAYFIDRKNRAGG